MKIKIAIIFSILWFTLSSQQLAAQDFGLAFSYFVPRHGYMSTPISPFSIRGIGKDLNRFFAIETGASLYRMTGLGMKDMPLKSNAPFIGPNYTIFVPLELVFQLKGNNVQFDIKGGGFFFYGFDQKLNYGNIDKAVREYENWAVSTSTLSFKNHPGFGYHAGAELTFNVTNQVALSLETNYLVGEAKFPLKGVYQGGNTTIDPPKEVDYKDAKIDFSGYEFSIGLIFNAGGPQGPKGPKGQKRRRR